MIETIFKVFMLSDLLFPKCLITVKILFPNNFGYNYEDTAAYCMACASYLIMGKPQRPTWKVSGNQHSGENGSLN